MNDYIPSGLLPFGAHKKCEMCGFGRFQPGTDLDTFKIEYKPMWISDNRNLDITYWATDGSLVITCPRCGAQVREATVKETSRQIDPVEVELDSITTALKGD